MTGAIARLGLGGAQFGMDYGITNRDGQVMPEALGRVLGRAAEAGIRFLDTAHAYGASEAAIGASGLAGRFAIVTKTPKLTPGTSPAEAAREVAGALDTSLMRLAVGQLDAVLVHDAEDLIGPAGDAVWRVLEEGKRAGRVRRLGVSVYHGAQIDALLGRYPLEVVQAPLNLLDRRLQTNGHLARMAAAGIAIHTRSTFLQGLLLADTEAIPPHLAPIAQAVARLRAWAASREASVLEAALAYPLSLAEIECCLVGISSVQELDAIVAAVERIDGMDASTCVPPPEPIDPRILDPSQWDRLRHTIEYEDVPT